MEPDLDPQSQLWVSHSPGKGANYGSQLRFTRARQLQVFLCAHQSPTTTLKGRSLSPFYRGAR